MSGKEFIEGKHDDGSHDGRRSTIRRIDEAVAKLTEWRRERTLTNLTGHVPPPELCYKGEVGHFGEQSEPWYPEAQDQEIILFEPDTGEGECIDTKALWMAELPKYNNVYNASISTTEDPRLKVD